MDLNTLTVLGALISVLLAGILALTLRSAPAGSHASLSVWILAVALAALYWPASALVDQASSLSQSALDSLIVAALLAHLQAVRIFVRRRFPSGRLLAVALAAAIGTIWFGGVVENMAMRVLLVSGFSTVLLAMMAWTLRAAVCRHGGEARRFMQALAGAGAAIAGVRVLAHFVDPLGLWSEAMPLVAVLYMVLFPVFASFAFILMHTDRANAELERLAGTDPLTGALNRRALEQLAHRSLSEARRHRRSTSLLMIDADHFKLVNDTYGHDAGDAVLRDLVRRIERTLRLEDAVGRIGGEEFVVLLPDTPLDEAVRVAERIRNEIGRHNFLHLNEEIPLTVSIGVAERGPGEGSFAPLLRRADDAMYAAKRAGRNRVMAVETGVEAHAA